MRIVFDRKGFIAHTTLQAKQNEGDATMDRFETVECEADDTVECEDDSTEYEGEDPHAIARFALFEKAPQN